MTTVRGMFTSTMDQPQSSTSRSQRRYIRRWPVTAVCPSTCVRSLNVLSTAPIWPQLLSGQPLGVRLFGYSLAGNMDLDKNTYPDLAVGSLSDAVFMFRCVNVSPSPQYPLVSPRACRGADRVLPSPELVRSSTSRRRSSSRRRKLTSPRKTVTKDSGTCVV